jgi:hypothetical protein
MESFLCPLTTIDIIFKKPEQVVIRRFPILSLRVKIFPALIFKFFMFLLAIG